MLKKKRRLISEGGNAVKNAKSIHQWEVKDTIESLFDILLPILGITKKEATLVGSAGKKLPEHDSGDLDVIFSKPAVEKKFASIEEARDAVKEKWNQMGLEWRWIEAFELLSVAFPITGREEDLVQIDLFFVDSLEYVTWSMYSPSERESKYKSAVRNQLITQTVTVRSRRVTSPFEADSEMYNLYKGIYTIHVSFLDEEGEEMRDPNVKKIKLIEDQPEDIASRYFGCDVEDLESAESTIKVIGDDPDFPEICWRITNLCVIKKEIPLPKEIHDAAKEYAKDHMNYVLKTDYEDLPDIDAFRKREWWSGNEIEREWQEWKKRLEELAEKPEDEE